MPPGEWGSLWSALRGAGPLAGRGLWGAEGSVGFGELIELDGGARRVVLGPAGLPLEDVPFIMATAGVDAVVSDRAALEAGAPSVGAFVTCSPRLEPTDAERTGRHQTEWILLTSGTTGVPKLVVHTLASLAGAIKRDRGLAGPAVWS